MDKTIAQKIFAGFNELNEIDKAMEWAKEKWLTVREMQEALRDVKIGSAVKENEIKITNADFDN